MNPSKTECIIFGNKKKRDELGNKVETPIGEITAKDEANILGLRIDNNLSFGPQFEHVMKKMYTVQTDILELIGYGTSRQTLKAAFSKSCGIYLYGIGIQPKWTNKRYNALQAQVLKAIRRIYDIRWDRENSWSQNDILRFAKWPPVRIQHAKMSLLLLNKTIMNRNINNFNECFNRFLKTGNLRSFLRVRDAKDRFERNPLDDTWLPRFVLSDADKKQMSTKIWKVFPFNTNYWLVKLPPFIRILLGSKQFEKAVNIHFNLSCWHRAEKACSLCRHTIRIYPGEVRNYTNLLEYAIQGRDITTDELELQSTEEIRFLRSLSLPEDMSATFDEESD